MFWFVFIGLLVIGYLLKFFNDLNRDKEDLKMKSLEEKFNVIVNILNQEIFKNQGTIFNISLREFNLGKKGSNSLVKFHYSTGHLTIIYQTFYLDKEFEFQKQFSDLRNISVLDQQSIGKEILDGMSNVIDTHLRIHIPTEQKPTLKNQIIKDETIDYEEPFQDCNDGYGYLRKKKVIKNGRTFFQFERQYINGKLWEKYSTINDKKEGESFVFEENGQLLSKNQFKNGIKHGIQEEYHDNRILKEKFSFVNGIAEGPYQLFYRNGNLNFDGILKNGKLYGNQEEYFENGKLKERYYFKNDEKDGPYEKYYETGFLEEKGEFKNGVKHIESNLEIHPLKESWWDKLTDKTKKTLLWNISFVPHTFKNNHYKETDHQLFGEFDTWSTVVGINIEFIKETDKKIILEKIWKLERIFIDKYWDPVSDLDFIKELVNIKSLNIRDNWLDLSVLSGLNNIEELHLWRNKVDTSPINTLSNLKELTLFECGNEVFLTKNLNDLKHLNISGSRMKLDSLIDSKNLKKLEISHCVYKRNREGSIESSYLIDLTPLSELNNLLELRIENIDSRDENVLNHLSKLNQLKKLNIVGLLFSINSLENLINLEYLKVQCNYRRDDPKVDLEPLRFLKKLKYLDIRYNESDLSPLSSLKNLRELNLVGNGVNLNPISELVNLEKLNLNQNNMDDGSEIIDFGPISNLVNLVVLNLNYNQITSLDLLSIKNLTKIEELDLSSNNINTLISLSRLKNLKKLNIKDNFLKDLIPLSQLTNLQELNIVEYDFRFLINDLSPISELPKLKKLVLNNPNLDITSISKRNELDIELERKFYYDI